MAVAFVRSRPGEYVKNHGGGSGDESSPRTLIVMMIAITICALSLSSAAAKQRVALIMNVPLGDPLQTSCMPVFRNWRKKEILMRS